MQMALIDLNLEQLQQRAESDLILLIAEYTRRIQIQDYVLRCIEWEVETLEVVDLVLDAVADEHNVSWLVPEWLLQNAGVEEVRHVLKNL